MNNLLVFSTVDDLAERAFELENSLGCLRGNDPCAIRADRCRNCGTPSTLKYARTLEDGRIILAEVCSGPCGRPWSHGVYESVEVLRKIEIDLPIRPGGAEAALAREIDDFRILRRLVFPPARPSEYERWDRERWAFALQAWRLFLHDRLGTYRRVAVYGAASTDDYRGWWTKDVVERWLSRARIVVARRASRRGHAVRVERGDL